MLLVSWKVSKIGKSVSSRSKSDKGFYLTVFNLIKKGFRPSKVAPKLGISKQCLNWYVSRLKGLGAIRKVGYGVWEVVDNFDVSVLKEVKVRSCGG